MLPALQEINSYFEKIQSGDYYATGNVGTIQGGKAINQVPDFAAANIDIRYPPSIKAEKIYADLQAIVRKHPHVAIEKIIEGSPSQVDQELVYYKKFRQIAKELYGIEVGTMLSHGSSDARFFGEKHIPVLVITSKGGEIHSDSEWVDLPDLVRFYEVMKLWVMEMAANPE